MSEHRRNWLERFCDWIDWLLDAIAEELMK